MPQKRFWCLELCLYGIRELGVSNITILPSGHWSDWIEYHPRLLTCMRSLTVHRGVRMLATVPSSSCPVRSSPDSCYFIISQISLSWQGKRLGRKKHKIFLWHHHPMTLKMCSCHWWNLCCLTAELRVITQKSEIWLWQYIWHTKWLHFLLMRTFLPSLTVEWLEHGEGLHHLTGVHHLRPIDGDVNIIHP